MDRDRANQDVYKIMLSDKCKKCRRAGQKLFLKGEKCFSPKCTLTRKPYVPGIFGKARGKHSKRGTSEYGIQLRQKQKIKFTYGLREKQFTNYVKEATKMTGGDTAARIFELLESRLDNVIFRLGLSDSRAQARQIVSHGHIMINGRRLNIPSYRVKLGDKISVKPQSTSKIISQDIDIKLKKYNPPAWLQMDKATKTGEVAGKPAVGDESGVEENLNTIIEFYSR